MPPQAAKWAECSSGTPTLPYHAIVQQGSEVIWMRTIRARGADVTACRKEPHQPERKDGANPGHDGNVTLASMRPHVD